MSWWRLVVACAAVYPASAVEISDPSLGVRLPAAGPELAIAAKPWAERWEELRRDLASEDVARRRGAARFATAIPVPPGELLDALVAAKDPEVRRLGAPGVRRGLDKLPPARLLALGDPELVCLLLGAHPATDPLADAAVETRLTAWIADPQGCVPAAELICARGSAKRYGPHLVTALSSRNGMVANTAHQALCVLTRTQRSFTAYAGHSELLVKDWQDSLAQLKTTRGDSDQEVMGLVADLPSEVALLQLLVRGPVAVAAVEQAMAGAERARRRELEVAARLLNRAVSPALFKDLGQAGFEGMDAAEARTRLASLTTAAQATVRLRDPAGLMHLLSYTDDRDPMVRAAAFDRLVRLSDESKAFGRDWKLGDDALFPTSQTTWRLRRALQRGTPDEQVSTLQLVASLEAEELSDEVTAMIFSPDEAVVDTAIEALSHLGSVRPAPLLRLAENPQQPAARRVKAIELCVKRNYSSDFGKKKTDPETDRLRQSLERLSTSDDQLVALAGRKALFKQLGKTTARGDLLTNMLAGTPRERHAALELIREELSDEVGGAKPAVRWIADADPQTGKLACEALLRAIGRHDRRSEATGWMGESERSALVDAAKRDDAARPTRLALILHLAALPRPDVLALVAALPADKANVAWIAAIQTASDAVTAIAETAPVRVGDAPLPDALAHALLHRVQGDVMLGAGLLEEIVALGSFDSLNAEDSDDNYGDQRTRTMQLRGGRRLLLTGKRREKQATNSHSYDDRGFIWTIQEAPESRPDAEAMAAIAKELAGLRLTSEAGHHRDMLVAVMERRHPDPAFTDLVKTSNELAEILAARDPALRARVVEELGRSDESIWRLRQFWRAGDPDLVLATVKALANDSGGWNDEGLTYLASVPPDLLSPHLGALLANQAIAKHNTMTTMLRKIPAVSLEVALVLMHSSPALQIKVAEYSSQQQAALTTALAAIAKEQVVPLAGALRRIRSANPAVFDVAMHPLAERVDGLAAAWLRTGLPLEAGWTQLYDQALSAKDPEIWLVGAAKALKESRLDPSAFLERVGTMPAPAMAAAALVAQRYLTGKLAAHGAALVPILDRCQARALPAWIAIAPGTPEIAAALAVRVRDPATATLLGLAIDQRARTEPEVWQPLVAQIVAAAGGRLDYLLPRAKK